MPNTPVSPASPKSPKSPITPKSPDTPTPPQVQESFEARIERELNDLKAILTGLSEKVDNSAIAVASGDPSDDTPDETPAPVSWVHRKW